MLFELIACNWRHGGHFGGKNCGEIWRHCYAKLERHFAIVLTTNMAVWSRDCNPRIQGGVAILTTKISINISHASIYNETIIASTSDQEMIKTGPWDLRTKSSLNPGRQTCGSRQNFTDLMGCRYVSSSMPQSWIVRGLKQGNIGSSENSHLKMNEKRLRNHKKKTQRFFNVQSVQNYRYSLLYMQCKFLTFLPPSSLWLFKLPLM